MSAFVLSHRQMQQLHECNPRMSLQIHVNHKQKLFTTCPVVPPIDDPWKLSSGDIPSRRPKQNLLLVCSNALPGLFTPGSRFGSPERHRKKKKTRGAHVWVVCAGCMRIVNRDLGGLIDEIFLPGPRRFLLFLEHPGSFTDSASNGSAGGMKTRGRGWCRSPIGGFFFFCRP